jgi:plastocyanin
MRLPWLALACSLGTCALGACASDDAPGDDDSGDDDAPSSVVEVDCASVTPVESITTSGFAYSPSVVTIAVGEVVEFHPTSSHDAVAFDGSFRVGFGDRACLRFDAPGEFEFECSPHHFTGAVTVE